jgi:hypothetical protein
MPFAAAEPSIGPASRTMIARSNRMELFIL